MLHAHAEAVKSLSNVMVKINFNFKAMNFLKTLTVILLAIPFFCVDGSAQGIQVTEHGGIRTVMNQYINQNQSNPMVEGWRIQIISTNDRRKMESFKAKFEYAYPQMYLNWEHRNPWYLVKVGAFKTKLELQAFIQDLKDDFPQAIPIKDQVSKSELIR